MFVAPSCLGRLFVNAQSLLVGLASSQETRVRPGTRDGTCTAGPAVGFLHRVHREKAQRIDAEVGEGGGGLGHGEGVHLQKGTNLSAVTQPVCGMADRARSWFHGFDKIGRQRTDAPPASSHLAAGGQDCGPADEEESKMKVEPWCASARTTAPAMPILPKCGCRKAQVRPPLTAAGTGNVTCTSPMHTDIRQSSPGNCPRCGMTFEVLQSNPRRRRANTSDCSSYRASASSSSSTRS